MNKPNVDSPLQENTFTHRRASMAMVIDILRASREIFYFSSILKKQESTAQAMLASQLEHASELIKELFEKLSHDQFPTGCCEQLEHLSHKLYFLLGPALGEHQARVLTDRLKQTYRVRLLHAELVNGIIDCRELVLLDEAANHFRDTAQLLIEKKLWSKTLYPLATIFAASSVR